MAHQRTIMAGDGVEQSMLVSSRATNESADYSTNESADTLVGEGGGKAKLKGGGKAKLAFAMIFMGMALSAAFVSSSAHAQGDNPRSQEEIRLLHQMAVMADDDNWGSRGGAELAEVYYEVFPHGNRNAASHRWATFVLDRAHMMGEAKLREFFGAFCPVSGSPIDPQREAGWSYPNLQRLKAEDGATTASGVVRHCCSPCVCDTQAHLRVDSQTVQTKDGAATFDFLVMGDPCGHPGDIPAEAPDVTCFTADGGAGAQLNCNLASDGDTPHACHTSSNGGVIVGMLLPDGGSNDAAAMLEPVPARGLLEPQQSACAQRAATGTQSGMGSIFIQVAEINPL